MRLKRARLIRLHLVVDRFLRHARKWLSGQPTNTQIEERTMVNANVTWRDAEQRYYVTAYGRNLTDKDQACWRELGGIFVELYGLWPTTRIWHSGWG